jgi:glycyl-tRNA synthetase (class II)
MEKALRIKDLEHIAHVMGKSKREEVRLNLLRLQEFLGSEADLFVDGRKKMWGPEGSARVKVQTRPERKTHKVTWRNGGTVEVTTTEAVKISRRRSAGALAVTLSKNGGTFSFNEDDDIVTIRRL